MADGSLADRDLPVGEHDAGDDGMALRVGDTDAVAQSAFVQRPAARRQPHVGGAQDQRDRRTPGDHRRALQVGRDHRRARGETAARRAPDQLLRRVDGIGRQSAIADGDPLQVAGRDDLSGIQPAIEHRHLDLLPQPPGHGEALRRRAARGGRQHGGEAPTRRLPGEPLDREFGTGGDGAPRGYTRDLQRCPGDIDPPIGESGENGLGNRRVRRHRRDGSGKLPRRGGNAAGLGGERRRARRRGAREKAQDRQRENTHRTGS